MDGADLGLYNLIAIRDVAEAKPGNTVRQYGNGITSGATSFAP